MRGILIFPSGTGSGGGGGGTGFVTSVNGQTGAVVLTASDIGYTPAYPQYWGATIPALTSTALDFISLGGIRPPTWTSQGDLFAYTNRPVLRYAFLGL